MLLWHVDARGAGAEEADLCWGCTHLQPCSGRQEGGNSSQRPPLGLLVRFRGSMRPVPLRLGMRSIRQLGTSPHSPGLSCIHMTPPRSALPQASRQPIHQAQDSGSSVVRGPPMQQRCCKCYNLGHLSGEDLEKGWPDEAIETSLSRARLEGILHECSLQKREKLACKWILSPDPELWHSEGSRGPERLLRGSHASPMPG